MRLNISVIRPDFLEAGTSGPLVVLVHSGVSGARQWRRLMDDLKDRYRVRAVICSATAQARRGPQTRCNQSRIKRTSSRARYRQTLIRSVSLATH